MKQFLAIAIIIGALFAGAAYVQSQENPCLNTLHYSIGTYDARFGLERQEFLDIVQDVESVWEDPLGKELFEYDPEASFKINLIFDDRMQKTLEERSLRQRIDLSGSSYDVLATQYSILKFQVERDQESYSRDKLAYEQRLATYNQEVARWNRQGGAPDDEFEQLQQEQQELNAQANDLEQRRVRLNQDIASLNALADRVNQLASELNRNVDQYNGRFGEARRFDQGNYTGSNINIFQFQEETDLRLVMAHEFGHALGIDHLQDPRSIMHYLMDQQDLSEVTATAEDIAAAQGRCENRFSLTRIFKRYD